MGCIQTSMRVKHKHDKHLKETDPQKGERIPSQTNGVSDADINDIALKVSKNESINSDANFPDYYENLHSDSSNSLDKFDTVSLPDVTEHPTYQTVLVKGRRSCKHKPGMMNKDGSYHRKSSKMSYEAETSILDCKICHKNHTHHFVNDISSSAKQTNVPSKAPSNVPSNAPSNVPSNSQSNVPSNVTSNVTSNVLSKVTSNVSNVISNTSNVISNSTTKTTVTEQKNVPITTTSKVSNVNNNSNKNKPKTSKSKSKSESVSSKTSRGKSESRASSHSPQENKRNSNVSILSNNKLVNLIAVNALYLAAPASDAILNNRKNEWVQLAGHPGSFAPASSHTIWKKRISKCRNEVIAYRSLMEESARDIIPKFYREVEHQGEYFMELQDLLQSFHDPNIIDIKMGIRTFLEPEVMNPVLRHDLYEKMTAIDPDAPTDEEHSSKTVTKLRYMQFREQVSSTADQGFRIEAIRMSGQTPLTNWKSTRSRAQISAVISRFFNHDKKLLSSVGKRLKDIRAKFELSHFFRTHEVIGSSLLLLYDSSGKCGAWMIDFAKTLPLDDGIKINHRSTWTCGNHEDGYLFGLDNLIGIFDKPQPQDLSCLDCFTETTPLET